MGPVRQNPIQRTVSLFICVCIALCTIVAHNIAQSRPDSFPPYPPDNHHSSDDVYLREGGRTQLLIWSSSWALVSMWLHICYSYNGYCMLVCHDAAKLELDCPIQALLHHALSLLQDMSSVSDQHCWVHQCRPLISVVDGFHTAMAANKVRWTCVLTRWSYHMERTAWRCVRRGKSSEVQKTVEDALFYSSFQCAMTFSVQFYVFKCFMCGLL